MNTTVSYLFDDLHLNDALIRILPVPNHISVGRDPSNMDSVKYGLHSTRMPLTQSRQNTV